jgi:hypothetical protein
MLYREQFKSIIPLWNWEWHPLVMGFLVFLTTFGGVITARILLEGHFYLGPWPAFYLGDTFCLPTYTVCATIVIRNLIPSSAFYTKAWWHYGVLISGYIVSIGLEVRAVIIHLHTLSASFLPSQLYHTLMFGLVYYVIVSSLPAVFASHTPLLATIIALCAILAYLILTGLGVSSESLHLMWLR